MNTDTLVHYQIIKNGARLIHSAVVTVVAVVEAAPAAAATIAKHIDQ